MMKEPTGIGGAATASAPITQAETGGLRDVHAALASQFTVIKHLGGAGQIGLYLAQEQKGAKEGIVSDSGQLVILKTLRDGASDSKELELFYQEAEAAAKLRHKNITQVRGAAALNGVHYSAIEYRPRARTLRHLLDMKAWLDPEVAVNITHQIAAALEYAHQNKVLHLRLSPESILLEPDGTALVTDFGIGAESWLDWARRERSSRAPVRYMSPEQVGGEKLDHRCDLFSAGVILFEMLTDRNPFDSESPDSVRRKLVAQTPLPPHIYSSSVPRAISAVVMELLEKNPEKRIQCSAAFRSAMNRLTREEGNTTRIDRAATMRWERDLKANAGSPKTEPLTDEPPPAAEQAISNQQTTQNVASAETDKATVIGGAAGMKPLRADSLPSDRPSATQALAAPQSQAHEEPEPVEAVGVADNLASNNPAGESTPEAAQERLLYEPPAIAAINPPEVSQDATRSEAARASSLPVEERPLAASIPVIGSSARKSRFRTYVALLLAAIIIPAGVLTLSTANPPSESMEASPNPDARPSATDEGAPQMPAPAGVSDGASSPDAPPPNASGAQGAAPPGQGGAENKLTTESSTPAQPRQAIGGKRLRPKRSVRRSRHRSGKYRRPYPVRARRWY